MTAYIVRRLLYTIPIVFGVLLITFTLFNVIPGDISADLAGKAASPETIAEIRHEMGMDKPRFINTEAMEERGFVGLFDSQFCNHFYNMLRFDFGRSIHGDPFIVMELLEGEDLHGALLRKERLSPVRTVSALLPIARALSTAHAASIVHRDIKPENILITRKGKRR